jgi:hypothetical protein
MFRTSVYITLVLLLNLGCARPSVPADSEVDRETANVRTGESTGKLGQPQTPYTPESPGTAAFSIGLIAGKGFGSYAIWKPFKANLDACAKKLGLGKCDPIRANVYRGTNDTCHYSGRAIDVGAIQCDGKVYEAISRGKYEKVVKCVKDRGMKVLYWQNKKGAGVTANHQDHGHFSLGCSIPGHPNYW